MTAAWKLVPIEPTLEMWKAGLANLFKGVDGVWKAMLEEAPKSPAAPDIGILKEVTEALAARLGTNADEWPLVRAARAIVEDAS